MSHVTYAGCKYFPLEIAGHADNSHVCGLSVSLSQHIFRSLNNRLYQICLTYRTQREICQNDKLWLNE